MSRTLQTISTALLGYQGLGSRILARLSADERAELAQHIEEALADNDIALAFGKLDDLPWVRMHLTILGLAPPVQDLVMSGKLPVLAAYQLRDMEPDMQVLQANDLVASDNATVEEAYQRRTLIKTGKRAASDRYGSTQPGVNRDGSVDLQLAEALMNGTDVAEALAENPAGKARCGCVYHAEQGIPCEHDLALRSMTECLTSIRERVVSGELSTLAGNLEHILVMKKYAPLISNLEKQPGVQ